MRLVATYFLLSLTGALAAPLGVRVRCDNDTYLVYEAIPVVVSVHNYSGRTIQIDESDQQSSLEFVVTGESGEMIRALGRPALGQPVLIPPGQTVSQTVNVLPLYELRERGTYRIQAVVKSPVGTIRSAPVQITLMNGREIWSRTVGLPVGEGGAEEYRTFALVARRGSREDALFVSVRDDVRSTVYSLVPLGNFLTTLEPQVQVDGAGNLHVLFQNGPRSFGYVKVNPAATTVLRAAYSDFTSRPTLEVTKDGNVSVSGGEQTYPKAEHILTDKELNPPPPPPQPKPKRRWWWPFGPKS